MKITTVKLQQKKQNKVIKVSIIVKNKKSKIIKYKVKT